MNYYRPKFEEEEEEEEEEETKRRKGENKAYASAY